jgi:hypothetical protein
VRKELKRLKAGLEEAKVQALISGSMEQVKTIEKQLQEMYGREKIMYKQQSRQEFIPSLV